MLLYSGHSFPASGPGRASDHGCWAEYTTTVSSVSSTDSASHSGKKCCCFTRGTPSQPQPQAQPQTMVVGQSIPQQYPQSPAQTVPPTQVRNVVVILRGTLSQPQAQPQTVVVGQSMPQQYPQSPAQTVPPTQVRNYVVILRALLPSLSPRPSLRPWLLGRVYHSSILSLQHRQCLLLRLEMLLLYSGALFPSLRPSPRPWLLGRVCHSSILSLQHRQCLPLR